MWYWLLGEMQIKFQKTFAQMLHWLDNHEAQRKTHQLNTKNAGTETPTQQNYILPSEEGRKRISWRQADGQADEHLGLLMGLDTGSLLCLPFFLAPRAPAAAQDW